MANRECPHDIEAERSLLGSMLISKDKCIDILNKTVEDDFYDDSHQAIFKAMAAINEEGTPVDVTTVTSYLVDHSQLDKIGGVDYLLRLSESVPTVAHSEYYLKILHNKATLRRIIRETTQIAENAYGDVENIDAFIDETEKTILKVTQDRSAGEFRDIRGVIKSVTDRLNLLQKIDGNISGVKSGFRDLDKITSGFQKGDLIILAARPAMGKTAFALNLAHNAAYKAEEPVAIFSLEMPAEQLVTRLICCAGSIDNDKLKTGAILKENANKYYAAADRVTRCNLYIDDTPAVKIGEIAAKCRRLQREQGLKMVIIDYLQLISGPSSSRESRQQEVSDISRQLKALARELKCPVIALSQLSRQVEQRKGKPMLSDLRESGAIEQDADIVAFLHREDYQNKEKEAETNGLTEIVVAKHRNGATADISLVFEKQYSRFSDYYTGPENQNSGEGLRI